jgi:hypothetical protein
MEDYEQFEQRNNPYLGMTTNERLFAAGCLDAFDAAACRRDRSEMVRLLLKTFATQSNAESIADQILSSPDTCGY